MMNFDYINWNTNIFMGFYESVLFNSDTEYRMSENDRQEGIISNNQYYEIDDFTGFMDDVASYAVDKLDGQIPATDRIVFKMEYKGISSPVYYNYSTDRLAISMQISEGNLMHFCFNEKHELFNIYLRKYFTSHDGFTSFIPNNIDEFKNTYIDTDDETKNNFITAMLEFYLLSCIYGRSHSFTGYETEYHEDLIDYAYTQAYNYKAIKTEDND